MARSVKCREDSKSCGGTRGERRDPAMIAGAPATSCPYDPRSASSGPPMKTASQTTVERWCAEVFRALDIDTKGIINPRVEAARRLGVDRTTLYRLMRKFGIRGDA